MAIILPLKSSSLIGVFGTRSLKSTPKIHHGKQIGKSFLNKLANWSLNTNSKVQNVFSKNEFV